MILVWRLAHLRIVNGCVASIIFAAGQNKDSIVVGVCAHPDSKKFYVFLIQHIKQKLFVKHAIRRSCPAG